MNFLGKSYDAARLYRLADSQKKLLYGCWSYHLIWFAMTLFLYPKIHHISHEQAPLEYFTWLISMGLWMFSLLLLWVGVFRVMRNLGNGIFVSMISTVASSMPVWSLVVVWGVSRPATRTLRRHGYRVGPFGVPRKSLAELRASSKSELLLEH